MPKWTKEQEEAIYRSGENIIVSAGAGSGKTAVLTERVIQKLQQGIHIHELLILTFTKAAAAEMKERIRKSIKKYPELQDELWNLDQAYITTFDSFSLSVLKKYHYVLGLDKNIGITESSLLEMKKKEILDDVFEELYEEENPLFQNMISSFCTKDDALLKNSILEMIHKFELRYDGTSYLEHYVETYYQPHNIQQFLTEYQKRVERKKEKILSLKKELSFLVDGSYLEKVEDYLTPILENTDYKMMKDSLSFRFPSLPRGSSEEEKEAKKNLTDAIAELDSFLSYGTEEEMIENVLKTKDLASCLIMILTRYFAKIKSYKEENSFYEFTDIAFMAMSILEHHEDIREELKNSFQEILIDEYQDTNDIQEQFISYIAHDNVYMVGDIKQSIYRFRNANPNIFKQKYNDYQNGIGGSKIDLLKNFRSRKEVLEDINMIFRQIMDNGVGGANYADMHQMVFGLTDYDEVGKKDESSQSEILTYDSSSQKEFTIDEIEAFLVAHDISEKVKLGYPVYDKETKTKRKIDYSDFVILMDRATNFELYKKIFEYLKIPLTLYKDEFLERSEDLALIKNLMDFVIRIRNHEKDVFWQYDFVSIARSFLYRLSDEEILDRVSHKTIEESVIYQDLHPLVDLLESIDCYHFLKEILNQTHFYEKSLEAIDIEKREVRISKILELATSLDKSGYSIYEMKDYLKTLLEDGYSIRYKMNTDVSNSVKIMTIHQSKGLEYPICYFTGLTKSFNISEIKERFIYHNHYGFILPYFEEGIGETFLKQLLKEEYLEEEVSEKIRLFYVALTRAREKMIFVLPYQDLLEKEERLLPAMDRVHYRKFSDILNSLGGDIQKRYQKVELDSSMLTKEYLYPREIEDSKFYVESELQVEELTYELEEKEEKHFSKVSASIPTKEQKEAMRLGTAVHEILEYLDFKNPVLEELQQPFLRSKIESFLHQPILQNCKHATIFKEHEFLYQEQGITYHGIIDCMLEYEDHIDLLDYKLKKVEDEAYHEQLLGYRTYLEHVTNKPVSLYLYSIMDNRMEIIL